MLDFDALEDVSSRFVRRVADVDRSECPRGECARCDCHCFLSGKSATAAELCPPHAYRPTFQNTGFDPLKNSEGNFMPERCLRCGCDAIQHVNITDVVSQLWESGVLVEADEGWNDLGRVLYRNTGGAYHPGMALKFVQARSQSTSTILKEKGVQAWEAAVRQSDDTENLPFVSVICPTTRDREKFHPFLYRNFVHQSHSLRELIVIDTGDGPNGSEYFTVGPPLWDTRVVYKYFDVSKSKMSIGTKRNIACHLSQGSIIVHFDDDDIYSFHYITAMVQALMYGEDASKNGIEVRVHAEDNSIAQPLRCDGLAAEVATLSSWYTFNLTTGDLGVCDVDGLHDCRIHRRDWAFGYGFSFAYAWKVWHEHWFRDMNLGEDIDFVESLLARGSRVVLLRDNHGVCAHTHHNSNFSPWEHDHVVPATETAKKDLKRRGRELLQNIVEPDSHDCNETKQRLRLSQAFAMQRGLLAALMKKDFQLALHKAWDAAEGDPKAQQAARTAIVGEVQRRIISKYGFENSYSGVMRCHLSFADGLNHFPDIIVRNNVLSWLVHPHVQHACSGIKDDLMRFVEKLICQDGKGTSDVGSAYTQQYSGKFYTLMTQAWLWVPDKDWSHWYHFFDPARTEKLRESLGIT